MCGAEAWEPGPGSSWVGVVPKAELVAVPQCPQNHRLPVEEPGRLSVQTPSQDA